MVKLQAEELQVHAQELSKLWRELDEERETRRRLQQQLLDNINNSPSTTLSDIDPSHNEPYFNGNQTVGISTKILKKKF
jgi:hypothetical protein